MEDKVGVFIFDSYFDVFMGLEEKYKRWDLFEAVFRYVRFDQAKRLPGELSKIFKVLKPILDVQKKKIIRNEKRRKVKKVGDCDENQEVERMDGVSFEEFCGDDKVDLEGDCGGKNQKIKVSVQGEKNKNKSVLASKNEEPEVCSAGGLGEVYLQLGDENKFGGVLGEVVESVIDKEARACGVMCGSAPNGMPNVVDNKKDNKNKSEKVKGEKKAKAKTQDQPHHQEAESFDDEIVELPSLDEVLEFGLSSCKEVDAAQFYNYYEGKKWMLRGKPIYDWRACMIKWNDKLLKKKLDDDEKSGSFEEKSGKFQHFEASYDSLEEIIDDV